jgi:hypothetical protein
MSRKGGLKMGMEMVGCMLVPALFVLKLPKLPVVLARAPGEIVYGSGGRVEDFALCGRWSMQQWQGRHWLVREDSNNKQWGRQC